MKMLQEKVCVYALAAEPCNSEADGSLPLLPLSPAHLILTKTKTKSKAKTKGMIRTLTPAKKCSKLFYLDFWTNAISNRVGRQEVALDASDATFCWKSTISVVLTHRWIATIPHLKHLQHAVTPQGAKVEKGSIRQNLRRLAHISPHLVTFGLGKTRVQGEGFASQHQFPDPYELCSRF